MSLDKERGNIKQYCVTYTSRRGVTSSSGQGHNIQPNGRVCALLLRSPTLLGLAGLNCILIGLESLFS